MSRPDASRQQLGFIDSIGLGIWLQTDVTKTNTKLSITSPRPSDNVRVAIIDRLLYPVVYIRGEGLRENFGLSFTFYFVSLWHHQFKHVHFVDFLLLHSHSM